MAISLGVPMGTLFSDTAIYIYIYMYIYIYIYVYICIYIYTHIILAIVGPSHVPRLWWGPCRPLGCRNPRHPQQSPRWGLLQDGNGTGWVPSGKHTNNWKITMLSSWVNPRFRLGHGFNSFSGMFTRPGKTGWNSQNSWG